MTTLDEIMEAAVEGRRHALGMVRAMERILALDPDQRQAINAALSLPASMPGDPPKVARERPDGPRPNVQSNWLHRHGAR